MRLGGGGGEEAWLGRVLQTARRLKQLRGAIKQGVLDNRIDFVHLDLCRSKVILCILKKFLVPDFRINPCLGALASSLSIWVTNSFVVLYL